MKVVKWEGSGPRWRYGLVTDPVGKESAARESYGVVIADCHTGQEYLRRHVTLSALDAAALLDTLARCQVSPVTLDDVLEDWLAR